jgi:DNA-binding response OmpR family regulator
MKLAASGCGSYNSCMCNGEQSDRTSEAGYVVIDDVRYVERRTQRRRRLEADEGVVDPWSYHARRGRGTIRLTMVEYRILRFLAAKPNQAMPRSRIADAASTERQPVTVESLGRYIHSLRAQLGFFSNYIQTVPFIGYRFKA